MRLAATSFPTLPSSGSPLKMRVVSTLTWTIRRTAATRSRGSSNQPLGSIDDAATLVLFHLVAVDEPLERCPAVDLVLVRFRGNAGQTDEVVDRED